LIGKSIWEEAGVPSSITVPTREQANIRKRMDFMELIRLKRDFDRAELATFGWTLELT